jgi:hypothetical protein
MEQDAVSTFASIECGEASQLMPMRNDDLFMFRTCALVIIIDLLWPL